MNKLPFTGRRVPALGHFFRPLIAGVLALSLAACGGSDRISQSALVSAAATGPLGGQVESFTPERVSADERAAVPLVRSERPQPSAAIVLGPLVSEKTLPAPAVGQPQQIGFGRVIGELKSAQGFAKRLTWTASTHGGLQAAMRFVSTQAAGSRLALQVSDIDPRTQLRFYGKNATVLTQVSGREVLDTIYRNLAADPGNPLSRVYFGPYVEGDEVTLDIELPVGVSPEAIGFYVPRLSHLLASPTAELMLKIGESGSCQVDVACRSDWMSTANGVARMLYSRPDTGSSYLCTGTLLNDRASSGTPYFLTANHCIADQASASTLQTFWFYRASACGSGALSASAQTRTGGATLLYTSNTTDTTFLRLSSTPPAGVSFNGWSSSLVAQGSDVGGVHHPKGDLQKVSLGQALSFATCSASDGSSFNCSFNVSSDVGNYLQVSWSSGVTEGGSSGSALYLTSGGNHYLVGQLRGGVSSCTNATGSEFYGRFDLAYRAALYQWLDNASTVRTPIYRFYNTATGAHFFTANRAERDYVIATYPQFKYESEAFYAYASAGTGLTAVYRFFNTKTGTHFFTANSAERDYVIATYPVFNYEGAVWYAKTAADGTNSPLFRFFNTSTGAHFYTMSQPERDYVIATYPVFNYEGTAYYAWTTP